MRPPLSRQNGEWQRDDASCFDVHSPTDSRDYPLLAIEDRDKGDEQPFDGQIWSEALRWFERPVWDRRERRYREGA